MHTDVVPQYVQPPTDPALQLLQQQAAEQRITSAQGEVAAANARHALMYGTRMALPTGSPLLSGISMVPTGGGTAPQGFGLGYAQLRSA